MIEEEIKKYLKDNKELFPLSFFELKYRKRTNENISKYKIAISEKYFTDNFPIYKFYKPITRF